jgi:hypothetical protein
MTENIILFNQPEAVEQDNVSGRRNNKYQGNEGADYHEDHFSGQVHKGSIRECSLPAIVQRYNLVIIGWQVFERKPARHHASFRNNGMFSWFSGNTTRDVLQVAIVFLGCTSGAYY